MVPMVARVWFVVTALLALLCSVLAFDQAPGALSVWWLTPLAVPLLARLSAVVVRQSNGIEVALDSVVLVFVAFANPREAAVLWAVGCVLAGLTTRAGLWIRVYNMGLSTLAGLTALTVIGQLPGAYEPGPLGLLAALLGATSYFVADYGLSALAVPLLGRGSLRETVWDETLNNVALCSVGVAALGYLGAVVLRHEPWTLLFVLVPVAAFVYASKGFADAHDARQRVDALFLGASGLHNATSQDTVGQVVTTAGRAGIQAQVRLLAATEAAPTGPGSVDVPHTDPPMRLVARKRAGQTFDDSDDRDLRTLASLAGDSLRRLRLLDSLERLARHDPLTGLPNRAALHEQVSPYTLTQPAVLFVDLDGFKRVNDRLGHEAGDLLLQVVARRLQAAVRPGDTVARLGGDEFAVLLPGADTETALAIGERIAASIREPVDVGLGPMLVGASIGVAAPHGPVSARDLLHEADVAMYSAKAAGGQVVLCTPELREEHTLRSGLADQLRGAGERGELVVHYQPVLDLRTGQTVGVESLARWVHPTRGLLAPNVFIALAEQTGLADEIGREVLRQLVRDAPLLSAAAGHRLAIGLNLSPASIVRGEVLADLPTGSHDDYGLVVEVLETTLADPRAVPVLADLRRRGVLVAVDDFGTGHSLAALRQLPVDTVKLDRAFVVDVTSDVRARHLVRFVEQLTTSLGVALVAEGIETAEQQDTLVSLGVTLGQGYHLVRPAPLADTLEALTARRLVHG